MSNACWDRLRVFRFLFISYSIALIFSGERCADVCVCAKKTNRRTQKENLKYVNGAKHASHGFGHWPTLYHVTYQRGKVAPYTDSTLYCYVRAVAVAWIYFPRFIFLRPNVHREQKHLNSLLLLARHQLKGRRNERRDIYRTFLCFDYNCKVQGPHVIYIIDIKRQKHCYGLCMHDGQECEGCGYLCAGNLGTWLFIYLFIFQKEKKMVPRSADTPNNGRMNRRMSEKQKATTVLLLAHYELYHGVTRMIGMMDACAVCQIWMSIVYDERVRLQHTRSSFALRSRIHCEKQKSWITRNNCMHAMEQMGQSFCDNWFLRSAAIHNYDCSN